MTADLVAFLRARLEDDEHDARAAQLRAPTPWRTESWDVTVPDGSALTDSNGDGVAIARGDYIRAHLVRHDPARALAEVDAKRRIIEQHHRSGVTCPRCSLGTEDGQVVFERDPCGTLRLLALPYADHPDYRAEWAPHVEVPRVRWLP
jgi:hypothetical protein